MCRPIYTFLIGCLVLVKTTFYTSIIFWKKQFDTERIQIHFKDLWQKYCSFLSHICSLDNILSVPTVQQKNNITLLGKTHTLTWAHWCTLWCVLVLNALNSIQFNWNGSKVGVLSSKGFWLWCFVWVLRTLYPALITAQPHFYENGAFSARTINKGNVATRSRTTRPWARVRNICLWAATAANQIRR